MFKINYGFKQNDKCIKFNSRNSWKSVRRNSKSKLSLAGLSSHTKESTLYTDKR